ncbi:MAG: hypothetical protein WC119_09500 [Synergistaceae bacterium]|jgi:hypothetical protein|nr:hypothetical protein [Synergistaceae bacterium]PKL05487.1 MAG: hypothetical protein CVV54_01345 [Synergistetes bacterium HGW-Synergistetes-1]
MFGGWSSKKADIPIDLVILVIAGLTMVIAGLLLFASYAGKVSYYENGLFGLLIFIYALQITVLGKTPFGDVPQRPLSVLILGIFVACIGIITCFIPDLLKGIPRFILFICFGPGGILLLLQMFFSKDKFPLWRKKGGILMTLAVNCTAVYSLSVFISILLIDKNYISGGLISFSVLLYGVLVFTLTAVLFKIYALYPDAAERPSAGVQLSDDRAVILITGVFMVLLGILLIPVTIGLLPFSGSAQLGLLVVIMSIQMIAFGNTPLRSFTRTWPLVFMGLIFASMGIISCIVPGILVPCLTLIIALLNIGGGVIPLVKMIHSRSGKKGRGSADVPSIIKKLFLTQSTLNILSIVFGVSMLINNLIPGPVIGVVLTANGIVLLYLISILAKIDEMKKALA